MSDINKTILTGRLTADPELRYTASGVALCNFTVAVNRSYKIGEEKKEEVSFINCVAWSGRAETLNKYVKKGHRIGLVGFLKQDFWDDKNTGKKRSKLTLNVDEFTFLEGKSGGQEQHVETGSFNTEEIPF